MHVHLVLLWTHFFFHLPISLSTKEATWFYKNYRSGELRQKKKKKKIITKNLPADTAPVIVKIYSSSLIGYR